MHRGIQYVGMVRPIVSEFEYVLTDARGVIDSFSRGFKDLMHGLSTQLFKEADINIQLIAPELILVFDPQQQ